MKREDEQAANRYVDGELSIEEADMLKRRASREPALAARIDELEGLGRMIREGALEKAPEVRFPSPVRERVSSLLSRRWSVPALPFTGAAGLALALAAFLAFDRPAPQPAPPAQRPVRLVYFSETARSVRVVGDFDTWGAGREMTRAAASGYWVAELSLPPGEYRYFLLVDGVTPVADMTAEYTVEDDYGTRNSVLRVGI